MAKKIKNEWSKNILRLQKLKECGNADHLEDENGNFKSEYPREKGKISIGYIEDVCQWTYYRKDLTNDEKLETILKLENMIQDLLSDMKIIYIPTWSTKLK
jgi:hypothetical protein